MLEALSVSGFKCLRSTDISFAPLTVLVGPNDSGKTSILEAIRWVCGAANGDNLHQRGTPSAIQELRWNGELPVDGIYFTASGTAPRGSFVYKLRLPWVNHVERESIQYAGDLGESFERGFRVIRPPGVDEIPLGPTTALRVWAEAAPQLHYDQIQDVLRATTLRLVPNALRESAEPQPEARLEESGQNLAAALDLLMTGPNREIVALIEKALHDAMPTVAGVALSTVSRNPLRRAVDIVLEGKQVVPGRQVSDGALLLLAYLVLAYSETHQILLVEEPENGLHPERLRDVVDLLRRMTTGEVGNRKRQVVLTTHSPILLNYVEPEEVRFVLRDPREGTRVHAATEIADLPALLEQFGLGELWWMLGERKLLSGDRSAPKTAAE